MAKFVPVEVQSSFTPIEKFEPVEIESSFSPKPIEEKGFFNTLRNPIDLMYNESVIRQ